MSLTGPGAKSRLTLALLVLATAAIVPEPSSFSDPLFPNPIVRIGAHSYFAAVADFNRDGHLDLIASNYGGQDVAVLLGDGQDEFGPPASYPTGPSPFWIAVGDFNRDRRPDIAVTSFAAPFGVSILLGNGDGTFAPATELPTGPYPFSVAIGDLNGDRKQDLAVAVQGADEVALFLGDGRGGFVAGPRLAGGGSPAVVAIGDLNADRIPDIVVTDDYSGVVSVIIGLGAGAFAGQVRYPVGAGPASMSLGDLNGDGRLDIAVAGAESNDVSVLLGAGDGTFMPRSSFTTGDDPVSIEQGDFNGDGKIDLVTADARVSYIGGDVALLVGNGDGTFGPPVHVGAGASPSALVAGDFNQDRRPDLVTVSFVALEADLLLNNGDGTLGRDDIHVSGGSPVDFAVADLDGDGNDDLAGQTPGCPLCFSFPSRPGEVTILAGRGDGTFVVRQHLLDLVFPVGIAIDDFDHDGAKDLVVPDLAGVLSFYAGRGDATFVPGLDDPLAIAPGRVASGDFNRDGLADAALLNPNLSGVAKGSLAVLPGNGDGTFGAATTYPLGVGPADITTGDLNGDGLPDIVVTDDGNDVVAGDIVVLTGHGDGTFEPPAAYDTCHTPLGLAVGDLNGDGRQDVAAACLEGSRADLPGGVSVLLGKGDGTLAPEVFHVTDRGGDGDVVIGDFNADGKQDVASLEQGAVVVRLRKRNLLFGPPMLFRVPAHSGKLRATDLDHDGRLDLVVSTAGGFAILLNQGPLPKKLP